MTADKAQTNSPGSVCRRSQSIPVSAVRGTANSQHQLTQPKGGGCPGGAGPTTSSESSCMRRRPERCCCRGGQLGLLVDLSQHLKHNAEQRTAQAEELKQEDIVVGGGAEVGAHSGDRPTHAPPQPSRQQAHGPAGPLRPAQAPPKQGNQSTWGAHLTAACRRADPTVQRRGLGVTLVLLQEREENHSFTQTKG